mmetsp:Transcript_7612/g.22422  ORF Transcript_7612/g.22422 Transcript_7612/m.22422 type:complete len:232 (+) Transcript_7612:1652-2347(+)
MDSTSASVMWYPTRVPGGSLGIPGRSDCQIWGPLGLPYAGPPPGMAYWGGGPAGAPPAPPGPVPGTWPPKRWAITCTGVPSSEAAVPVGAVGPLLILACAGDTPAASWARTAVCTALSSACVARTAMEPACTRSRSTAACCPRLASMAVSRCSSAGACPLRVRDLATSWSCPFAWLSSSSARARSWASWRPRAARVRSISARCARLLSTGCAGAARGCGVAPAGGRAEATA